MILLVYLFAITVYNNIKLSAQFPHIIVVVANKINNNTIGDLRSIISNSKRKESVNIKVKGKSGSFLT